MHWSQKLLNSSVYILKYTKAEYLQVKKNT